MFASHERNLNSAITAMEAMASRKDLPKDIIADAEVVAVLLKRMRFVESSGEVAIRENIVKLTQLLGSLKDQIELNSSATRGVQIKTVDNLIQQGELIQKSTEKGIYLEEAFRLFLHKIDDFLLEAAREGNKGWYKLLGELTLSWTDWQNSVQLLEAEKPDSSEKNIVAALVKEDSLQQYMQSVLDDPSAVVSNLRTIPGGFGKETSMFTVSGDKLSADLVMRRDLSIPHKFSLNCHQVSREYQLFKALFERGFPVPEPLWLAVDPEIIPGPNYMIVRKVAGDVVGDVTGGKEPVSDAMRRQLATITAKVHSLPPLKEIGDSIPALHTALWDEPIYERAYNYITSLYEYHLEHAHMPVPAIHHLFSWLLSHIPKAEGSPVLIHGDMGFHNLLISNGQISSLLDWEHAHVGDPAEDLGYIKNGIGGRIDWDKFLQDYASVGRPVPDEKRILFYQIWAHVRNASGTALMMDHFEMGRLNSVRCGILPFTFAPYFIAQAEALIKQW